MTYDWLRYGHLVGLMLMGAGLIGVWLSDLRSRRVQDLALFTEAIRSIAVFYDGVVVPGALLLLLSGIWMTWEMWGGWNSCSIPGLRAWSFSSHLNLSKAIPSPGSILCDCAD